MSAVIATGCYSFESEAQDQADMFISAFSQSCDGFGLHTQNAIGMTSRYLAILDEIRKDTQNCGALYSVMNNVRMVSVGLDEVQRNRGRYYRELRSNSFLGELFSALDLGGVVNGSITAGDLSHLIVGPGAPANTISVSGQSPDFGNVAASLGRAFAEARGADLAKLQEEITLRREHNGIIAQYLKDLPSALSRSESCIIGHPNVAATLIGQTLALAGAYTGGYIGGAMSVVGGVLNELTEYFRRLPLDRAVRKGIESKFYPALSCGLEAMVNTYCRTADARRFFSVQVQELMVTQDPSTLDYLEGLELLSRNYPKLRTWLQKIETGALADNPERARRNNKVLKKEALIEQADQYISGEFGSAMRDFQRSNDPIRQRAAIQKFVRKVADFVFDGAASGGTRFGSAPDTDGNPYYDFFPVEPPCMFQLSIYLGLGNVPEIPTTFGACDALLTNTANQATDLMLIKSNLDAIQTTITNIVHQEKSRVLGSTFDPQSTWLEATDLDALGRSNLRTFERSVEYLTKLVSRWEQLISQHPEKNLMHLKLQKGHARDFISQINIIITMIKEHGRIVANRGTTSQPTTMPSEPDYLGNINKTAKVLRLDDHFDYFIDNMLRFVEADLSERIRNNELDRDLSDLLKRAASDYISRIYSKTDTETINTNQINDDLNNALGIAEQTIDNYASTLGHHIIKGIKSFNELSSKNKEPTDRAPELLPPPHYTNAAKLCLLALSSGDKVIRDKLWEDPLGGRLSLWGKGLKDVCKNIIYYTPVHKITKLQLKFEDIISKPWEQRVCAFYDLKRRTRIFELHSALQSSEIKSRFDENVRVETKPQ